MGLKSLFIKWMKNIWRVLTFWNKSQRKWISLRCTSSTTTWQDCWFICRMTEASLNPLWFLFLISNKLKFVIISAHSQVQYIAILIHMLKLYHLFLWAFLQITDIKSPQVVKMKYKNRNIIKIFLWQYRASKGQWSCCTTQKRQETLYR